MTTSMGPWMSPSILMPRFHRGDGIHCPTPAPTFLSSRLQWPLSCCIQGTTFSASSYLSKAAASTKCNSAWEHSLLTVSVVPSPLLWFLPQTLSPRLSSELIPGPLSMYTLFLGHLVQSQGLNNISSPDLSPKLQFFISFLQYSWFLRTAPLPAFSFLANSTTICPGSWPQTWVPLL